MSIPRRAAILAPFVGMVSACSTSHRAASPAPSPSPSLSGSGSSATGCVTLDSYSFDWVGDACASGDSHVSDDQDMARIDWNGPLTLTPHGAVAWYRSGLVEWNERGEPVRLLAVRSASTTAYALLGQDVVMPMCDGRLQRWSGGCPGDVLPGHRGANVVAMSAIDESHFASLGDDQQLMLWSLTESQPIATTKVANSGLVRLESSDGALWASAPTACFEYDARKLTAAGTVSNLPASPYGWAAAPGRRLVGHADTLIVAQMDKGVIARHDTKRTKMYAAASPDGHIGAIGQGRLVTGSIDGPVARSGYPDAPHHPAGLAFSKDGNIYLLDHLDGGGKLNPDASQLEFTYESPAD